MEPRYFLSGDEEDGANRLELRDDAVLMVDLILVKTLEEKPKGKTHWSTRGMAAHVGIRMHVDQCAV